MTPPGLHLAASRIRLGTIACLARLGADPDARCQNGWTPLDWALWSEAGQDSIIATIDALLEAGGGQTVAGRVTASRSRG